MTIFPNPLYAILRIIPLVAFAMIVLFSITHIFNFKIFEVEYRGSVLFLLLALIISAGLIGILYIQVSESFIILKLKSNSLTIVKPLKCYWRRINFKDIRGYSNSNYKIGGLLSFSSKSKILYFKTDSPVEIIKTYNLNYSEFAAAIVKNFEYLGSEPSLHGLKRKYQYLK